MGPARRACRVMAESAGLAVESRRRAGGRPALRCDTARGRGVDRACTLGGRGEQAYAVARFVSFGIDQGVARPPRADGWVDRPSHALAAGPARRLASGRQDLRADGAIDPSERVRAGGWGRGLERRGAVVDQRGWRRRARGARAPRHQSGSATIQLVTLKMCGFQELPVAQGSFILPVDGAHVALVQSWAPARVQGRGGVARPTGSGARRPEFFFFVFSHADELRQETARPQPRRASGLVARPARRLSKQKNRARRLMDDGLSWVPACRRTGARVEGACASVVLFNRTSGQVLGFFRGSGDGERSTPVPAAGDFSASVEQQEEPRRRRRSARRSNRG